MKQSRTLRAVEALTNEPRDKKMKFCINCGNVATHTAYFKVEGATIIERYCDTCIKTIEEHSNLSNVVKRLPSFI
ncbi:MAG: hypothetical protein ABJB85_08535 [Nitrososphaerota archaeon]